MSPSQTIWQGHECGTPCPSALCATINFVNQARGWRLKHTKTHRDTGHPWCQNAPRMPPLLYSGADYIGIATPQPNAPETTLLPSGTPDGLVLRAAVGTQIREKQVVYNKFRIVGFTAPNSSWGITDKIISGKGWTYTITKHDSLPYNIHVFTILLSV